MKRKRTSFSKLLLLLESAIVLYTTYQGFGIAKLAIELGYYAKAKAENTAGGVTYETVCRGQDCEG